MISARRFLCIFIGLFLLYAVLRAHTLLSPVLHDEGLFLAGAQACAQGELPYRDYWDHKPPGIFWLHSIPLRLFPYSRLAVKVSETVWIALSATVFWFLCRRLFSRGVALATLGLYMFYTSAPITIRSGGLTEELALTWHVLAYLLVMVPRARTTRSAVLAGIALAVACQFRQTYVLSAPVFVWIIWRENQSHAAPATTGLRHLAAFLAGLVIPEMLVSLYFFCNGAWCEYVETSYWFNFLYVRARGMSPTPRTYGDLLRFVASTGPFLASPLLACASFGRTLLPSRRFLFPLLLLFVYDMTGAVMSGEGYEHYYVQASVSSCLLIGLLLQSMVRVPGEERWGRPWRRPDRIVLFLVFLALCGTGMVRYGKDVHRLVIRHDSPRGPLALQRSVAEAVEQLTRPEDRILLLGKSPNSVYMLAHRGLGARYYHNSPLFKEKFRHVIPERFRERFLSDLRTRRPVVILLGMAEKGEGVTRGLDLVRWYAPFMLEMLDEGYVPLEDLVEALPPAWSWYGRSCSFLIRRDRAEEVAERLRAAIPSSP